MGWWMVAAAYAAKVDEDRLAELRDAVAPAVEAAVGRRLVEMPPVQIQREADVRASIWKAVRDGLVGRGVPAGRAATEADALSRAVVDDALAIYDGATGRVYVVKEHVEAWAGAADMPDHQLEAVCSCVLAHELTHALQDQHAPDPPGGDPDLAARRRALDEGQAKVVEGLVCTGRLGEAGELLRATSPAVRLEEGAPAAGTPAFLYDYGAAWVADLWRREGAEAVWTALGSPPTHDELSARVSALRSEPWWQPDWIRTLAGALDTGPLDAPAPTQGKVDRVSLTSFLRGLWPNVPLTALPRSDEGLVFRGEGAETLLVGAWTVPDARAAAKYLSRRTQELVNLEVKAPRLFARRPLALPRPRIFVFRELGTAFLFHGGGGTYDEAWVLDGQRLLLVAATSRRVRPKELRDALAELLPTLPAAPAPAPPVTPAGLPEGPPVAR